MLKFFSKKGDEKAKDVGGQPPQGEGNFAKREGISDHQKKPPQQSPPQQQTATPFEDRGDGGASLYRQLEMETIRQKEELLKQGLNPQSPLERFEALTVASPPPPSSSSSSSSSSPPPKEVKSANSPEAKLAISSQSQKVRAKRLMKEYKDIQKTLASNDGAFTVELCSDNLFMWDVKVYKFDPDSALAKDLMHMKDNFGIDNIWLRITFPDTFPFAPPFVRVIAPLILGGFVVSGGAICMELLTPEGWSQAYTVEAVIMQICATIAKGNSRIVSTSKKPYNEEQAIKSYQYLVRNHAKYGWNTPPQEEG